MATEQEREAVARKLHEAIAGSINLSLVARLRNADAAIAMRDAAVAEALHDATAEIARLREEMGRTADAAQWALDLEFERHAESKAEIATLRAKIAAVQDVVNSTTIRTRIDEAWVEKLCRALERDACDRRARQGELRGNATSGHEEGEVMKTVQEMSLDELCEERERRVRAIGADHVAATKVADDAYRSAMAAADVAYDTAYEAMQDELEPLIAAAEAKEA